MLLNGVKRRNAEELKHLKLENPIKKQLQLKSALKKMLLYVRK